jgi:hypothetical protein
VATPNPVCPVMDSDGEVVKWNPGVTRAAVGARFWWLVARTKGTKGRSARQLPCTKTKGEMGGVGAWALRAKEGAPVSGNRWARRRRASVWPIGHRALWSGMGKWSVARGPVWGSWAGLGRKETCRAQKEQ